MPPRGYMPPYEDPYYARPPTYSSRQGPDWGYERRPMWNGAEYDHIDHYGHGAYHHGDLHHDIVSETPYHDYNHDVYQHHGQDLISDLEHDYDDLWQIIEGQTPYGVEHHDVETFDYYTPVH